LRTSFSNTRKVHEFSELLEWDDFIILKWLELVVCQFLKVVEVSVFRYELRTLCMMHRKFFCASSTALINYVKIRLHPVQHYTVNC
jgi:hypothetical protein